MISLGLLRFKMLSQLTWTILLQKGGWISLVFLGDFISLYINAT